MSQQGETFFTSVGCMDGRVQDPIAKLGREKFGVLFADTITEAGIVGILSHNPSSEFLDDLKSKVLISVEKHHSKGIIVHGHEECAGNPVDEETHKKDILNAVQTIKDMAGSVPVIAAYVKRQGTEWVVEEISQTEIA